MPQPNRAANKTGDKTKTHTIMNEAIVKTDFRFEGQKDLYVGKVRDV